MIIKKIHFIFVCSFIEQTYNLILNQYSKQRQYTKLQNTTMYKCIIFDIDGTMLNTEKAILCSLQKLLEGEKNVLYKAEDLFFVLGIPGHETLKRLNVSDPEQSLDKWNELIKRYASNIHLYPDIEKTIACLSKSGIKTGIVTSKTRKEYNVDFVPFGLSGYFQYVVCADDTIRHKPHPDPLLKCIELANVLPEEALYVGDTIYDMECAKAAGVDFVLALWGAKNHNLATNYKFSTPKEILLLLKTCPTLL